MTALHLAKPDDLDRLLPLAAAFRQEVGGEQTDAQLAQALAPLLEGNPLGVIYLIGPARAPLGYAVIGFGWSLDRGGMIARLEALYIRPAVRGRGIASEVLASLPRALGQAGVRALDLEVAPDNEAAQRLFARARFAPRERVERMSKTL